MIAGEDVERSKCGERRVEVEGCVTGDQRAHRS